MSEETPSGEEQQSEEAEGVEEAGEGRSGENAAPGGITDPPPEEAPTDVASGEKLDAGDEGDAVETDDADPASIRPLPENEVLRNLVEKFDESVWTQSLGQDVVTVPAERFAEVAAAAKDAGFETCVDVTAVDWLRKRPLRFEVVANLLSMQHRLRLRIVAGLPREEPTVPSLTGVWSGASFAEREVYDMFGIVFEGHPDLTRILMPDEWEGYPLRKDFGVGSVPVQFKDSHKVR